MVERGAGSLEDWAPVADAVRAELKRSGVKQGRPEKPSDPAVPLPVMTCGEIADTPAVRAATTRARAALAGAYRGRKAG